MNLQAVDGLTLLKSHSEGKLIWRSITGHLGAHGTQWAIISHPVEALIPKMCRYVSNTEVKMSALLKRPTAALARLLAWLLASLFIYSWSATVCELLLSFTFFFCEARQGRMSLCCRFTTHAATEDDSNGT